MKLQEWRRDGTGALIIMNDTDACIAKVAAVRFTADGPKMYSAVLYRVPEAFKIFETEIEAQEYATAIAYLEL